MKNNKYIVKYNWFIEKETSSFDVAVGTLLKGIWLETFWNTPFICELQLNDETIIKTDWFNIDFWKDLISEFNEHLKENKVRSKFTANELIEIDNNLNNLNI